MWLTCTLYTNEKTAFAQRACIALYMAMVAPDKRFLWPALRLLRQHQRRCIRTSPRSRSTRASRGCERSLRKPPNLNLPAAASCWFLQPCAHGTRVTFAMQEQRTSVCHGVVDPCLSVTSCHSSRFRFPTKFQRRKTTCQNARPRALLASTIGAFHG